MGPSGTRFQTSPWWAVGKGGLDTGLAGVPSTLPQAACLLQATAPYLPAHLAVGLAFLEQSKDSPALPCQGPRLYPLLSLHTAPVPGLAAGLTQRKGTS